MQHTGLRNSSLIRKFSCPKLVSGGAQQTFSARVFIKRAVVTKLARLLNDVQIALSLDVGTRLINKVAQDGAASRSKGSRPYESNLELVVDGYRKYLEFFVFF